VAISYVLKDGDVEKVTGERTIPEVKKDLGKKDECVATLTAEKAGYDGIVATYTAKSAAVAKTIADIEKL